MDARLFSKDPEDRLDAARAQNKRATKALLERAGEWPPNAPGSLNAWLLLVTTKEPLWRDALVGWQDSPLTLGVPHQGFYYPDPLGFWAEIRTWAIELVRLRQPGWTATQALALTSIVPTAGKPARVARAVELFEPRVVLFLDEPSWADSLELFDLGQLVPHYIADPHRPKQAYEGFWAERRDGLVVGKSPQHPAAHNLYRADDLRGYLRSAPIRPPAPPEE